VVGILAEEGAAVAAVDGLVAPPARQVGLVLVGGDVGEARFVEVVADLQVAGVVEPPARPLAADGDGVGAEGGLVALPHEHGRVVLPGVRRPGEGPDDLEDLDPLLAEALVVEHSGRRLEVGEGDEGLHARLPSCPAGLQAKGG
jgi:hypothetical protein